MTPSSKQKSRSAVSVARFISLVVKPGCLPMYRVRIDRKGFFRDKDFTTQKGAEKYRDEQIRLMPASARDKKPALPLPPIILDPSAINHPDLAEHMRESLRAVGIPPPPTPTP